MGFKIFTISWAVLILANLQVVTVYSETTWVWSSNRSPQSSSSNFNNNNNNGGNVNSNNNFQSQQNPNFGQTNLGSSSDRFNSGGKGSIFPESPARPSSSNDNGNNKDNSALPEGTIRVVNGQGEARLIPGAANFVQNALQNIGGGGGSGNSGGGGGGGLLGIGGNLLGSFFQNAPQFANSALGLLFGRPAKGNSNNGGGSSSSSNNGVTTLPASAPSFPILNPGGGGSRPSSNTNTGSSNTGSGSGIGSTGDCKCIPLNSCFLPSRPNGSCAGGNIMCCQTSSGTRAILNNDPGSNTRIVNNNNNNNNNNRQQIRAERAERQQEVGLGLLENIVRGSGNVVDDTLDLLLQRYYTEEDQLKLANRIAKSG